MTTDQTTQPLDLVAHGLKAAVAAVRTALAPFDNGRASVLALNADRAAVLAVAALEAAGWQPQDDEVLAEEFRKGFEAGEVNAALLYHAETERLRAVADAAVRWRVQFDKPADTKLPRMAALIEAVDKPHRGRYPMTTLDLEPCRARAADAKSAADQTRHAGPADLVAHGLRAAMSAADVPDLIAEVEQLRAQVVSAHQAGRESAACDIEQFAATRKASAEEYPPETEFAHASNRNVLTAYGTAAEVARDGLTVRPPRTQPRI